MPAASITPARGTLLRLSDEGEEAAVPKSVLRPLLALNAVYLVLATLGPHYGWTVMILVGAVVSAVNLLVVRAASAPPRR